MVIMAAERGQTASWKQRFATAFSYAVTGPIATAWEMAPQTLVTSASVFMVAQFGMAHAILPVGVALPMALGFEWTWLRGIRTAGQVRRDSESEGWIKLLTYTALITVIAYGILYIIGLPMFGVIPAQPGPWWGVGLAIAKVIPIALMGFAAANLHRVHKQQVLADQEERNKQEQARRDQLQAQDDAIEQERKRRLMELDVWRQGLEVKRAMRAAARPSPVASKQKPITIDGVAYPSRAAAAQALGITPQAVSKRAKKA